MAIIGEGISNPDVTFNFEGLDYKKGIWEIYYGNVETDNQGQIIRDKVTVGIRSIERTGRILQHPIQVNSYKNSTGAPYADLDVLILDLTVLLGFDNGGRLGSGINITQREEQFDDLLDGTDVGDLAYVENSQGTQWLPNSLGGTYFPAGWYIWNGTDWVSDRNAIANQLENNILDITSLETQFAQEILDRVSGDTGSVTIHSDIINAGSGEIITNPERLLLNNALQNETVTNLQIIGNTLRYTNEDGVDQDIDLSLYLDDTNLSRIITGVVSPAGILTVTRDDNTTFDIDLSILLDTDSISSITGSLTVGNIIAVHNDGNGNATNILETITGITLVNNILSYSKEDGTTDTIDLSLYLDDTNLARLTSGTVDGSTGIATFTRDDNTTFTVDFSNLFDDTNLSRIISGSIIGTDLVLLRDDSTTITIDFSPFSVVVVSTDLDNDITQGLDGGSFFQETVTSLAIDANILSYVKEDGTTDTIDLSLYLDDSNLARLISGVLDSNTGIATFTRDDNSTFTLNLSSLLDNQNASEVPYDNTTSTLSSTDAQSAIDELKVLNDSSFERENHTGFQSIETLTEIDDIPILEADDIYQVRVNPAGDGFIMWRDFFQVNERTDGLINQQNGIYETYLEVTYNIKDAGNYLLSYDMIYSINNTTVNFEAHLDIDGTDIYPIHIESKDSGGIGQILDVIQGGVIVGTANTGTDQFLNNHGEMIVNFTQGTHTVILEWSGRGAASLEAAIYRGLIKLKRIP